MDYQDLVKKEREERDGTRIANLQKLIARYGSSRAFSIAISRSPAQIGNMMRGIRPFGDTIKDHIEKTLNLPEGYLDQPIKPEGNVRPLTETESKTYYI